MIKLILPISIDPEKVRGYFNWAAMLLAVWLLAGIVGEAVASFIPQPVESEGGRATASRRGEDVQFARRVSRYAYDVVVERNIFDSANRIAKKKLEKPAEQTTTTQWRSDGPPQRSNLPVTLVGTIVSSNPNFSMATIKSSSRGEAEQFFIGDKLLKQATITTIERNRVYFVRDGRKEYIETTESVKSALPRTPASPRTSRGGESRGSGVREVAPGKYTVDRGRVESVVSNLSEVMTQARVVPHFENGKSAGWKIFAIKPNSIYAELSLKNGDIIQRINGVDIDSPAKALEMYQQLASETNISIDLIRRGKKQTFDYEIR